MIIPAGVDSVQLQHKISTEGCELIIWSDGNPKKNPHSYAIRCQRTSAHDIYAKQAIADQIAERPMMFAIDFSDELFSLIFVKKTDKQYYAKFRFNPPMKEI